MNPEQSAPSKTEHSEAEAQARIAEKRDDITATRLLRVQEYIQESLKDPSAERARLGSTSGMLWRLLFELDDAIQATFEADSSSSPNVEVLARTIDITLKLARQISGFSRLYYLLDDARRTLPAVQSLSVSRPQ